MSLKEVDRYAVIELVLRRTMEQSDAALWLRAHPQQEPDVTVQGIVAGGVNGGLTAHKDGF